MVIQMNVYHDRYFQHFKGGLYKLLYIAKDSETLEPIVVYQAMYESFDIWVRSERNFFSLVNINGNKVPRFRELKKEEIKCLRQKTKVI